MIFGGLNLMVAVVRSDAKVAIFRRTPQIIVGADAIDRKIRYFCAYNVSDMKHPVRLLLAVAALWLLTACEAFRTLSDQNANTALGRPYEVVVVCSQPRWEGPVGDSLRRLLRAPVEYINQTEPLFNVLRILPNGFANTATRHRNILLVESDPSIPADKTGITAEYDRYASPQLLLTLRGPSDAALCDYLGAHGSELVYVLEKAERDRAVDYAARYTEKHIARVIEDNFGVRMKVPKGYVLAKSEPDFLWARFEYPTASQGFCLYTYPYRGRGSLTPEALLAARNRFVKRIPGPSEGSYMTTSDAFPPEVRAFRLGDRPWLEMRGFWDVEHDFMGGPFVSYTTVDETTGQVFTLDGYVYSPQLDKRNFLRGVEHLLYMISFPSGERETGAPSDSASRP